jgi:hypothetical protein
MESNAQTEASIVGAHKPVTVGMIAKGVFVGTISAALAGAAFWYGVASLLRATGDIR